MCEAMCSQPKNNDEKARLTNDVTKVELQPVKLGEVDTAYSDDEDDGL